MDRARASKATACSIETEATRPVASNLCFGHPAKQFADLIEHADIRRWIRGGGRAYGILIHQHNFAEMFDSLEFSKRTGSLRDDVQTSCHSARQRIHDQRTFPRSADTRDTGECLQRNPQIHVSQVVLLRPEQFQPLQRDLLYPDLSQVGTNAA